MLAKALFDGLLLIHRPPASLKRPLVLSDGALILGQHSHMRWHKTKQKKPFKPNQTKKTSTRGWDHMRLVPNAAAEVHISLVWALLLKKAFIVLLSHCKKPLAAYSRAYPLNSS